MTIEELRAAVRADQLASFVRLKGGYTFPIAGAIYWASIRRVVFAVYGPEAKAAFRNAL